MTTTIEEYLRGTVGFELPDNALNTIKVKRGIADGAMTDTLTTRQLDLCTADTYMWCASTPSKKTGSRDSHGNWSHHGESYESSAFDKRNLRKMANDIYSQYGEGTCDSGFTTNVFKL